MKNPTCQWFYITVILYGLTHENTASSTSTANVTSTTMKSTSSTIQPDTPSTSSASPIDSSEAPIYTSPKPQASSIPSNTSSSLPSPSLPPTTPIQTSTTTEPQTSETSMTTEAPVSETTITNEATTIKNSMTTEAPTNETITTTELPANVTTTTTELPANVTTTTTELPANVTTTTTELPANVTTTTTELLANVTTTTTELPANVTTTTTELPANVTNTTTELPANVMTTTTELPVNVTTTTTELPTSETTTSTELQTSETTTSTESTTSETTTTTEPPTSETTTPSELTTTETITTTEPATSETTIPTEPPTSEMITTTDSTTNRTTTTTEPATSETTTPTETTTSETITTTEPATNGTTTTTETTTSETTTTTDPTTNGPTNIPEPTTNELTTESLTIETTTEILTTGELTTEKITSIETTSYASTVPTTNSSITSVETSTLNVFTTPEYKCRTLSAPEHGTVTKADGDNLYSEATFKCNVGYNIEGSNTSKCLFVNETEPEPEWIPEPPTCKIVDCGPWNSTINNYVTYTATTYQSTAVSICYTGYAALNRTSTSTTCLADGTWEKPSPPHCLTTLECEFFNHTDVNVTFTQAYQVNSTATFTCPSGFAVIGYKSITCKTPGVWSAKPPKCQEVAVNIPDCGNNKDSYGLEWNRTSPGEIATTSCRKGFSGQISRRCSTSGRWLKPVYDCISEQIAKVDAVVENLESKEHVTEKDLTNALGTLNNATDASGDSSEDAVYSGELEKVTSILDTIVNISAKVVVTEKQSQSFVNIASNLLNTKNTASWQSISEDESQSDEADPDKPRGAAKILDVVGKYSDVIVRSLNSTKTNTTVETKNLVLHASKIAEGTDVKFPDGHKDLNLSTKFELSKDDATGINNYSAIVYKNISGIMSSRTSSDGNNSESLHDINSAVMSIKMSGLSPNFKINITFGHLDSTSYTGPLCSFWNTTINAWSDDGCRVVKDGGNETVCQCDHLTNFAILMSPWTEKNVISKAMDIISTIGCSVSLLGLLLTVIIHIVLWRHLRSDRVVLLMNLSVALIVSYCLFIGGVDRTENKDLCTAIAVLLHYIYLAVFFLMLAEGIELAVILLSAFSSLKSRLKWMIPSAWLIPAVIVAISIGATQLEGYGNEQTCWLTVDQGLIWSFVGPALTVILVNFVLLVISLKAMFGVKSLADKSRAEKARTGLRTLCILLPLMGCTWVIGIFYVNENLDWIQYVFAVCNSLQGLVIFVMHVLCNKQVSIAIQKRRRLYYQSSLASKKTTSSFSMPRATLSQDSGNYSMDGFRKRSPSSTYDSIQTSKYF